MHTSGLDEELAEAVDGAFYESYRTWKHDNPTASTRQQVTKRDSITKILFCSNALGLSRNVAGCNPSNSFGQIVPKYQIFNASHHEAQHTSFLE